MNSIEKNMDENIVDITIQRLVKNSEKKLVSVADYLKIYSHSTWTNYLRFLIMQ